MLNKKNVKILSTIILVAVILMSLSSVVCAAVSVPTVSDVPADKVSELNNTVGLVLGIIQWGGIAIAVVIAMVIGIKYITASPEGKAEVKKTLGFYVAGIAILLTASAIVTAISGALGK